GPGALAPRGRPVDQNARLSRRRVTAHGGETVSPPWLVLSALQMLMSMAFWMNWTWPSQKATFRPLVCRLRAAISRAAVAVEVVVHGGLGGTDPQMPPVSTSRWVVLGG